MNDQRRLSILRNGVAFVAMVAICGAALVAFLHTIDWFEDRGMPAFTGPLGADVLCGILGYLLFTGSSSRRTWLVFTSVMAFGGLLELRYDPEKNFFLLLGAVPFAAGAAIVARAIGLYIEKRRIRNVDA
jgi:hypothetical protein